MNKLTKIILNTPKGQFLSVIIKRKLKLRAGIIDNLAEKETILNVRAGVEYDNINVVKEKRDEGILPEINQGLPWGVWEKYPFTIKHNKQRYVRLSLNPAAKIESSFFLNNKKVEKEIIAPFVLKSEIESKENSVEVITVKEDNIVCVNGFFAVKKSKKQKRFPRQLIKIFLK